MLMQNYIFHFCENIDKYNFMIKHIAKFLAFKYFKKYPEYPKWYYYTLKETRILYNFHKKK